MFSFHKYSNSGQRFLKVAVLSLFFAFTQFDGQAQYINKVFDYANDVDWGNDIFILSDSSFNILSNSTYLGYYGEAVIHVSADGNQVISQKILRKDQVSYYVGNGNKGRVKKLKNGNYLLPLLEAIPAGLNVDAYANAGFGIVDSVGDSIMVKVYNQDTGIAESAYDCTQMPDGGYIVAGGSAKHSASPITGKGLLIRTDSNGTLLWKHEYTGWNNKINSIQVLPNGNLLIGAEQTKLVWFGQYFHYKSIPNFIIADSANGNIIKSVYLYTNEGGGNIFKDANGGYYHWGRRDTMWDATSPSDYRNYPDYLMRLDDSFHKSWYTEFKCNSQLGHRYFFSAKQTKDKGYIVMGSHEIYIYKNAAYHDELFGWAAKINAQGFVVWEHDYIIDSSQQAYITDVAETPTGGYAFTGNTRDNSLPVARSYDAWLIVTDSNGCIIPGCDPLNIKQNPSRGNLEVTVYPNPVNEQLTIKGITKGAIIQLFDITGREVYHSTASYSFEEINTSALSPGTYILQLRDKEGNRVTKKLIKE